jgi:hypothetical protein
MEIAELTLGITPMLPTQVALQCAFSDLRGRIRRPERGSLSVHAAWLVLLGLLNSQQSSAARGTEVVYGAVVAYVS